MKSRGNSLGRDNSCCSESLFYPSCAGVVNEALGNVAQIHKLKAVDDFLPRRLSSLRRRKRAGWRESRIRQRSGLWTGSPREGFFLARSGDAAAPQLRAFLLTSRHCDLDSNTLDTSPGTCERAKTAILDRLEAEVQRLLFSDHAGLFPALPCVITRSPHRRALRL
jgi:hypothetical protein